MLPLVPAEAVRGELQNCCGRAVPLFPFNDAQQPTLRYSSIKT